MSNVIELPVFSRNPADRVGEKLYHRGRPYWRSRYRCPGCGIEKNLIHGALYVSPMQICDRRDGCGAEMCPVEGK